MYEEHGRGCQNVEKARTDVPTCGERNRCQHVGKKGMGDSTFDKGRKGDINRLGRQDEKRVLGMSGRGCQHFRKTGKRVLTCGEGRKREPTCQKDSKGSVNM